MDVDSTGSVKTTCMCAHALQCLPDAWAQVLQARALAAALSEAPKEYAQYTCACIAAILVQCVQVHMRRCMHLSIVHKGSADICAPWSSCFCCATRTVGVSVTVG